jgi:hypothetical protein
MGGGIERGIVGGEVAPAMEGGGDAGLGGELGWVVGNPERKQLCVMSRLGRGIVAC